jgi:cytochrome c553
MVREPKNVDFVTTGRELSEDDFARISEWIKQDKQKKATRKPAKPASATKVPGSREAA